MNEESISLSVSPETVQKGHKRMINNMLARVLIPLLIVLIVILYSGCRREQKPVTEIPSHELTQSDSVSKAELLKAVPPFTGQPLLFINKNDAALYSKPSESSSVYIRLKRDALLVVIDTFEGFIKVYAPITGNSGYVRAEDVTDSTQEFAQYQMRCNELTNQARMKLLKAFDRFPSIEALEKYYLYPFISSDDMKKMISIYKGDIGNYVSTSQPVAWELVQDSLPKAVIKKFRSDSLKVSMFSSGSKVVLLAGEPFLYTQNDYDEEGVIKKPSGKAVRTIKSTHFVESIRLIKLTRETGLGPIIVTHGPPHSQCHQCESLISLFGVGEFIHTYEKRVPVRLILKTGFADGYITKIVHSTFEVSDCYQDGGKGLFSIETTIPESEKIYGILLGLDSNVTPVVNVQKNGDWTADLNNDGISDLKCLLIKNQDYDDTDLLSAYCFINSNGKWILTDIRIEPECS